jgi:Methyltransferase FkbM domain
MAIMDHKENTLHTVMRESTGGDTRVVSLADAIARIGGPVDFIKLDCEGAEWQLFDDHVSWSRIGAVGMEYHLWAKAGSTVDDLRANFARLGFDIVDVEPSGPEWGMLFAVNRSPRN